MAIEYMVGLPCPVKDALGGGEGLVAKLKSRAQGEAVLEALRRSGGGKDLSKVKVMLVRTGPEGPVEQEVPVATLMEAGKALEGHEKACKNCPARVRPEAFGCYGAIRYPLSKGTEEWLLGRLPPDLDCTAGGFLQRAVADFGYDGGPVPEMRTQGQTFFEDPDPLAIRWGESEEAFALSTDQLLQAMFFVGDVRPSHALMLSLFLGCIPHGIDVEEFQSALRDPKILARHFIEILGPDPNPDPQVSAFKLFFEALRLGATLQVDVEVDA